MWWWELAHIEPSVRMDGDVARVLRRTVRVRDRCGSVTVVQHLGHGLDLLVDGGRRFFVPNTTVDEERCARYAHGWA